MKKYNICLRNLTDLEKYADLLERFSFEGFIKGDRMCLEADDVLELFRYCPLESAQLYVDIKPQEESLTIGEYLIQTGLLVS